MKRADGHVTWLVEFEPPFAGLVSKGLKRQTLRRCSIVEPGDTLRLASADTGAVFAEVTVKRVRPIEIGISEAGGRLMGWAELAGRGISAVAFDALAIADGFADSAELVRWLDARGKFFAGLYDGQLIEW